MATAAPSPRVRAAGAAWLAAGGVFLLTEAAAAERFTPRYSYLRNFISELGSTVCKTPPGGPPACSPLAGPMNLAFAAAGLLFVAAMALAASTPGAGRERSRFLAAGLAHGVGLLLVAVVHGGAPIAASAAPLHVVGAILAIVGGNLAIAVSPVPTAGGAPALLKRWGGIACAVGLAALVLLVVFTALRQPALLGFWERVSCYSIISWELVFGGWLLFARRS